MEDNILIIWECDQCGHRREEPEGYNEGGDCHCGGQYQEVGVSYPG